jgi:hypothetical protein
MHVFLLATVPRRGNERRMGKKEVGKAKLPASAGEAQN